MSTQFRSRTASRRPSQASMISADDLPTAADAFPRRAGSVLKVSKRDAGFVSPTKGTFSFEDAEELPPHAINSLPDLIDEKQIARHVSRGAPGDQSLMNMVKRNASTRDGEDASKRNTQYYTEVFAYREPNLSTREKIHKLSVITAEVKTNVIVGIIFSSPNPQSRPTSTLIDFSPLHRFVTSMYSLTTSPNNSPSATKDLHPLSSSPSTTLPASSSPEPLTLPTYLPSPPCPPKSKPPPTSATPPSSKPS